MEDRKHALGTVDSEWQMIREVLAKVGDMAGHVGETGVGIRR